MPKRLGPKTELKELERFLAEIERKFLSEHLGRPTLSSPTRKEALDVAAFVVLAHGAMENFIEGLGLWALDRIENSWTHHQKATRCTVALLMHQSASVDDSRDSVFNIIRKRIEKAKSEATKQIGSNNGIAPKHLRALFTPIGVDVTHDPLLIASLDMLVSLRHQWAHQYRFGAKSIKTAENVKQTVADCLELARRLVQEAQNARP